MVLGAQLAGDRSKDAGANRLALVVDQHRRIAIEADQRAVRTAHTFSRAHDHSPHHLTLFHATTRYGILHRHHDGVSDARVLPFRSAEHLDALDAPGPGVVGYVEIGFHLNHRNNPLG